MSGLNSKGNPLEYSELVQVGKGSWSVSCRGSKSSKIPSEGSAGPLGSTGWERALWLRKGYSGVVVCSLGLGDEGKKEGTERNPDVCGGGCRLPNTPEELKSSVFQP